MRRALVLCALLLAARAARADCTLSITNLSFGSYDILNTAPTDAVATATYSCTAPAVSPTVVASTGGAGSFTPRRLTGPGGATLEYNLYLDAARTVVFGDGTAGTSTFTCSTGTNLTLPIYGRIPARQTTAPVGLYSDTVTYTINF